MLSRCSVNLAFLAVMLASGPALAVAPIPAVLALGAATMIVRRSLASMLLLLGGVVASFGAARSHAALAGAHERYRAIAEGIEAPTTCVLKGRIVRSPMVVAGGGAGAAWTTHPADGRRARIELLVDAQDCGVPALVGTRARLFGAPEDLARGDEVEAVAAVAAVQLFANPELGDARVALARSGCFVSGSLVEILRLAHGTGIRAAIDHARSRVRARIEASYAPGVEALARALVLGEADLVDAEREAFRASGLSHILAVSGTHLVVVVLTVVRLLTLVLSVMPAGRRFDAGRFGAAGGLAIVWLYADFAGGSGSALRAAAMLTFVLAARVLARRPSGARCLALTVVLASVVEPLAMCDASFAMSLGATLGLLAAQQYAAVSATGRGGERGAAGGLLGLIRSTLAAQCGCLPVVLWLSPDVPVLGVFANVIAAPIGELAALPACLLHAATWWAPSIERAAALLGGGALVLVRTVALGTASSPLAALAVPPPTHWQAAVAAVAVVAAYRSGRARRLIASAALVATLLLEQKASSDGAPVGELRITVLDVGQGDSVVVDLPDGRVMLIDTGGRYGPSSDAGRRVLAPLFRQRRRARIDVLVITHPHADHFGGLASLLAQVEVGEVWDNGVAEVEEPDGELASVLRGVRSRGVRVLGPADLCGGPRSFGSAAVTVLAPCPEASRTWSHNDNSLVLRVVLGRASALLAGDAEAASEELLVAAYGGSLRSSFLKVGHHGGDTSTRSEFLAAVAPEVAAISAGVRNRFGHPHPRPLHDLRRHGATIGRTDRDGALEWTTDGATTRWRSVLSEWDVTSIAGQGALTP